MFFEFINQLGVQGRFRTSLIKKTQTPQLKLHIIRETRKVSETMLADHRTETLFRKLQLSRESTKSPLKLNKKRETQKAHLNRRIVRHLNQVRYIRKMERLDDGRSYFTS